MVETVGWVSIPVQEVAKNMRFDASSYDLEGRDAIRLLKQTKYSISKISDYVDFCFYPKRFKREYVNSESPDAIGFLGSSEMLDINPKPFKFLSEYMTDVEELKVNVNDILLSRSGTIGNLSIVNKTLSKYLFSEHSIRIRTKHYGFIASYLRSDIGQSLIKSNIFGSVVNQIEPFHILGIDIPNIPESDIKMLDKKYDLINYNLELSNELEDKAFEIMYEELNIKKFQEQSKLLKENGLGYSVDSLDINMRFDASNHNPLVNVADKLLKDNLKHPICELGNICKNVILPGRFKRSYVSSKEGAVFFGGKQIKQLDPNNKKYLSMVVHGDRIKEQLTLKKNMVLVTCSGTIGKTAFTPKYWDGWAANQHILRLVFDDPVQAGYIYAYLSSSIGQVYVKRFTYGSVVDEIDDTHIKKVTVPMLTEEKIKKVGELIIQSSNLRSEAYKILKESDQYIKRVLSI